MNKALEFIKSYPAETREKLLEIRALILYTLPNVTEMLKWKLPFYSYKGLLF